MTSAPTSVTPEEGMASLPRVTGGGRRGSFVTLVVSGLGQAAITAVTAVATPHLLNAPTTGQLWAVGGGLLGLAVIMGLLRLAERVLVERIAQRYVHEVRLSLVGSALGPDSGPNIGITVARTTNDLSALRNWVVLGLGPLAVGIPVLLGAAIGLAVLDPTLALAVVIPMLVLGAVLGVLAKPAYERARLLRRRRGSMASFVADTVSARESIRSGGGVHREVKALDGRSRKVADQAVSRAVVSGGMRGAAAAAASAAVVVVAMVGALTNVAPATVATAFILIGMVSQPINDLGRVGEYRQQFKAAARIIGPQLDRRRAELEKEERKRDSTRHRPTTGVGPGVVHVTDLWVGCHELPELVASPGQVVHLHSDDATRLDTAVGALTGIDEDSRAWVSVAGCRLGELPGRDRRSLVGHASGDVALPRGTVERTVRYRAPESTAPVDEVLDRVGLGSRVAGLPKGARTVLRRGGEPLTRPERARVALARSVYADPPLLVVDGIEDALGGGGIDLLADVVTAAGGVVVVVGDSPLLARLGSVHEWDLDATVTAAGRARGRTPV